MTDKIYLIGNKDEYDVYEQNINNIDALPLKNLPSSYFPFYYNQSESSIKKLEKLVPLMENYTRVSDADKKEDSAAYTINTDTLFSHLTSLEEAYQPYNNKNIFHITVVIVITWTIIGIYLLKMLYFVFGENYSYFVAFMIFVVLVIATVWSLFITSQTL
jgi:hypothetical protein